MAAAKRAIRQAEKAFPSQRLQFGGIKCPRGFTGFVFGRQGVNHPTDRENGGRAEVGRREHGMESPGRHATPANVQRQQQLRRQAITELSPHHEHQLKHIHFLLNDWGNNFLVLVGKLARSRDQFLEVAPVQRGLQKEWPQLTAILVESDAQRLARHLSRQPVHESLQRFGGQQLIGIEREIPGERDEMFPQHFNGSVFEKTAKQHLQVLDLESNQHPSQQIAARFVQIPRGMGKFREQVFQRPALELGRSL